MFSIATGWDWLATKVSNRPNGVQIGRTRLEPVVTLPPLKKTLLKIVTIATGSDSRVDGFTSP